MQWHWLFDKLVAPVVLFAWVFLAWLFSPGFFAPGFFAWLRAYDLGLRVRRFLVID